MTELVQISSRRESWRNTAAALRAIADDLESGEEGPCVVATLVLLDKDNSPRVFNFGPQGDEGKGILALELAKAILVNGMVG